MENITIFDTSFARSLGLFFNMFVEWIENDVPISSEKLAQVCFESINF